MPQIVLTSLAILALLAAGIKPLRSGFYLLHMLLVLAGAWLATMTVGDAPMFSKEAGRVFLILHLLSINALTFLAYFVDKRAAKKSAWRVPEYRLQALAMVGGTPAAWFAQRRLRHKTRKASFRKRFWAIVAFQLALLLWLFIG